MHSSIDYLFLVFYIINTIAHLLGFYLLWSLYRGGQGKVKEILLLNLSFGEALMSILFIITWPQTGSFTVTQIQYYVMVTLITGFYFFYVLSMILITLDRFLEIFLNITYPLYITNRRVKYTLAGLWVICMLISISVSIVDKLYLFLESDECYTDMTYIYMGCDVAFITIAILAYGYIFQKFRKTRKLPFHTRYLTENNSNESYSIVKIFINSRFYVYLLLIASYFFLDAIPNSIDLTFTHHSSHSTYTQIVKFCCQLSYFIDALIYIFLQPSVRRLLLEKLRFNKMGSFKCRITYMRQMPACLDIKNTSPSLSPSVGRSQCSLGTATSVVSF